MVEHTECSKPSRTSQAIICIKSEIICQNVAAFSTTCWKPYYPISKDLLSEQKNKKN